MFSVNDMYDMCVNTSANDDADGDNDDDTDNDNDNDEGIVKAQREYRHL